MKKKWIFRHCDLDLWPKVISFNRVRASVISNYLTKTTCLYFSPYSLKISIVTLIFYYIFHFSICQISNKAKIKKDFYHKFLLVLTTLNVWFNLRHGCICLLYLWFTCNDITISICIFYEYKMAISLLLSYLMDKQSI